jgi:hypothetical protein
MADVTIGGFGTISLPRLCTPRRTVFERGRAGTVANIADFNAGRMDGRTFFA